MASAVCFSSSFFWDLQKGQSGFHAHFSTFGLLTCSSGLGSSFKGGPLASHTGHALNLILSNQIVFRKEPVSVLEKISQHLACAGPWGVFSYWH